MAIKKLKTFSALILVLFLNKAIATTPQDSHQLSFHAPVEKALPSVVSIQTTSKIPNLLNDKFFNFILQEYTSLSEQDKTHTLEGLGSGVIVDKNGHILTNYHVIKGASDIKVKLADDRVFKAKVIGSSPDYDLAVLKIKSKNLKPIQMGDSQQLKVGNIVLAIGSPLGLGQTVTQGIISGVNRKDLGIAKAIKGFLQTDAAINEGNSGGALINTQGQLIGINMAIATTNSNSSNIGINFAIPVNTAKKIMKQLIAGINDTKSWFGVYLTNVNNNIRTYTNYKNENGAYVQATVNEGAAQNAGILPGDIITKINSKKIKNAEQALEVISNLVSKKSYHVEVFRNHTILNFKVMAAQRPKNQ